MDEDGWNLYTQVVKTDCKKIPEAVKQTARTERAAGDPPAGVSRGGRISTLSMMMQVCRSEGVGALYAPLGASLVMAIPQNVFYFVAREYLQEELFNWFGPVPPKVPAGVPNRGVITSSCLPRYVSSRKKGGKSRARIGGNYALLRREKLTRCGR